jgi:hypothetical protein
MNKRRAVPTTPSRRNKVNEVIRDQTQLSATAQMLQDFMTRAEQEVSLDEKKVAIRANCPPAFYKEVRKLLYLKGEITNFILLCFAALAENRRELTIGDIEALVMNKTRG